MPNIIYSTSYSNYNQDERKKELIEKLSPKNDIKSLMDMMNDFTDNLKFDDLDEDKEADKEVQRNEDKEKKFNKSGILTKEKGKKYKEFF